MKYSKRNFVSPHGHVISSMFISDGDLSVFSRRAQGNKLYVNFCGGGKTGEQPRGGGVGVKGHPFIQPLGTMLPFHWNNQDTNSTYSSQRSGHRVSGFVV